MILSFSLHTSPDNYYKLIDYLMIECGALDPMTRPNYYFSLIKKYNGKRCGSTPCVWDIEFEHEEDAVIFRLATGL